jgi:hypothetical protein
MSATRVTCWSNPFYKYQFENCRLNRQNSVRNYRGRYALAVVDEPKQVSSDDEPAEVGSSGPVSHGASVASVSGWLAARWVRRVLALGSLGPARGCRGRSGGLAPEPEGRWPGTSAPAAGSVPPSLKRALGGLPILTRSCGRLRTRFKFPLPA